MTAPKYLGKKVTGPTKELDRFPTPEGVTLVEFTSKELTAFCPITHQPDFYEVQIQYVPLEWCLESKSLKLYLWSFREEHAFAETLACRIAKDIFDVLLPTWVNVHLVQNVRGGLTLAVEAEVTMKAK